MISIQLRILKSRFSHPAMRVCLRSAMVDPYRGREAASDVQYDSAVRYRRIARILPQEKERNTWQRALIDQLTRRVIICRDALKFTWQTPTYGRN